MPTPKRSPGPADGSSPIVNCQRRVSVAVTPLADFFERVRREMGFPREAVTIRLIGDSAMAYLNRTFRGKVGSTDVLSFPVNASRAVRRGSGRIRQVGDAGGDGYIGDIAISPQTAARNARRFARTLQDELRILILHGMIHLAGYDHETDHGEMDRLEARLRRRLNLAVTSSKNGKRNG